jgi:hypothetical protein
MKRIAAKDMVTKKQVGLEQLAPPAPGAAIMAARQQEDDEALLLLSEARRKVLAGEREDALWRVVEVAGRLCQEFPHNPTARMVAARYPTPEPGPAAVAARQLRLNL